MNKTNPRLFAFVDDLSAAQLVSLLAYVMSQYPVSFRVLRSWRKANNLPVDPQD